MRGHPRFIVPVLALASVGVIGCFVHRPPALQPGTAPTRSAPSSGLSAAPPARGPQQRAAPKPDARYADLHSELRHWRAETDPLRRDALLKELLAQLTDANIAELVRSLSPDLLDTPFGEIALKHWAALDHRAAATWLEELPGGASEFQAGLATYGWLEQNREELHAYVDGLAPGTWRDRVITAATNDALLLKDGPEAAALLLRLPSADQRNEMLGWASTEWAKQDPARAAEWVQKTTDPALQRKLFGAVAVGYAWSQPEKAADLLNASGVAAGDDPTAVASVMNIWSTSDPAAATDWAARKLEGSARLLAIRCTIAAWAKEDMAATKGWIESRPEGDLRAQAERTAAKVAAAREGREMCDE